jgi:hypothetical protein
VRDSVSEEDWIVASSPRGIVEWKGLVPGDSYRWGVISSPCALEMNPPFDGARVVLRDGAIETTSDAPPRNLSGRMTVSGDSTSLFRVRGMVSTGVHGLIRNPDGSPALRAVVKCFSREVHTQPNGPGAVLDSIEEFTETDSNGRFSFRGLLPGQKAVRAFWESSADKWSFALCEFTLNLKAHQDLGTLGPKQASQIACRWTS